MPTSRLASIPTAELARIMDETGRWLFRYEMRRRGESSWTDLSNVAGGDWGAEIAAQDRTPDQTIQQATIGFIRASNGRSLAPGIAGDPFNQVLALFKPLVHPGSEVRVWAANLVQTDPDSAAVWRLWLEHEVQDDEWPGAEVVCTTHSWDTALQRAWIEEEEERGADDPGVPMEDEVSGLMERWDPDDTATLYTPVSPAHGIGKYKPAVGSLGEQVRTLAQRIGWSAHFVWDNATNSNRYTLYEPPRDKATPDLYVAADQVREIPGLRETREHIRTGFALTFVDEEGNQVTRRRVNSAARDQYGYVFFGLTEREGSSINTVEKADALLALADNDLSKPLAEMRVRLPFNPWISLHDLLEIAPDDARFDTPTRWAVVGASHRVTATERYTEVELRGGGPVGQFYAWHARASGGFSSDVEARSLYDFKVIRREDDGTLVYGFKRRPQVHSVWWAAGVYTNEGSGESEADWEDLLSGLAHLTIDEIRLPPASQGQYSIAHVEPRDRNMQPGNVWRTQQFGTPPEVRPNITFTESADGTESTVTVELIDPRGVVTGIPLYLTTQGVRAGPFAAASVGTLTWEHTFALHPDHPVTVEVYGTRNDGQPDFAWGPFSADTDKIPGIPTVSQVRDGDSVVLMVDGADTDTAALYYREVIAGVPGAETLIPARGSDPRFGSFPITAGSVERRFHIYGKSAAGEVGPYKDERVAPYFPPVDTLYARGVVTLVSSDADSKVLQINTVPAGGTVTLTEVSGTAGVEAGPAVGAPSADGTQWTFSRGAADGGSGQVSFDIDVAGHEPDTALYVIEAQGRDTVPLLIRAEVINPTTGGATVRVYAADPYPGGDISIGYTFTGLDSVTPSSPQTVLAAGITADLDTTAYVDFPVLFGSTPGRVVLTASRAGRLDAVDAADLPAADRSNGISEVLAVHVANDGGTAFAVAHFDPDTITGTAAGEYRLDGGPAVSTFDINVDREGEFNFARSISGVRVLEVRGSNDAGTPGPWHRREVDRYDPPPPAVYSVTPSVEDTGVGGNDVYQVDLVGAAMSGKTVVVEFYRNGVLRDTEDFAIITDTATSIMWTDLGVGDAVSDQHFVRVQLYSGTTAYGPPLTSRTVPSAF